jgi:hypothetical protein
MIQKIYQQLRSDCWTIFRTEWPRLDERTLESEKGLTVGVAPILPSSLFVTDSLDLNFLTIPQWVMD